MKICVVIKKICRKITVDRVAVYSGLVFAVIGLWSLFGGKQAVITIIFAVYIFMIAVLLVHREFVYSRKARYAETMRDFHECLHKVRDSFHDVWCSGDEEISRLAIREVLVPFANVFTLVTMTRCRACIKIIKTKSENSQPQYHTKTFVRSNAKQLTTKQDKESKIDDNSDFLRVFYKAKRCFFCNDLKKENPYLNSNWPNNPEKRKEFIKKEKYDYISTIVWPIRGKPESITKKPETIGFLCIDSLSTDVFMRKYDFDAGAIIADALYPLLKEHRDKFYLKKA
ncbi:MAG: hypothetical protein GY710_05505 [Desulfobacteraceae bacterium]|nr:hypothetical protein [Desulfobacteraceae bacterium]